MIKILRSERIQDGVERLEFSVGLAAVEQTQASEKLLYDASNVYNVPPEQLPKTAERFFKEWKDLQKDKKRLLGDLASRMIVDLLAESTEVSGFKIIIKDFDDKNIEDLIKIGDEIISDQPNFIIELIAIQERISVVLMAGKNAIENGFNCGKVLGALVKEFGGGGGGKKELGQGGGISIENLAEFKLKSLESIKQNLQNI